MGHVATRDAIPPRIGVRCAVARLESSHGGKVESMEGKKKRAEVLATTSSPLPNWVRLLGPAVNY